MRLLLRVAPLAPVVACSVKPSAIEFDLKGTVDGEDIDEHFSVHDRDASLVYSPAVDNLTVSVQDDGVIIPENDEAGAVETGAEATFLFPSMPTAGPVSNGMDLENGFVSWYYSPFVEYFRATGKAGSPVVLGGTIDGTSSQGGEDELKVSHGVFELYPDCDPDSGESYYRLCGNSPPGGGSGEGNGYAEEMDVSLGGLYSPGNCPDGVVDEIVDGAMAHWSWGEVQIGKGAPMECVETDDENRWICGTTIEGVGADGCSWTVDAVTDPQVLQLVITATASSSCKLEEPYCTAGY